MKRKHQEEGDRMTALQAAFTQKINLKPTLMNSALAVLVLLFAASLFSALHPTARYEIRGTLLKDYRSVVSSAYGDLLGNGSKFTVIKVKTRDSLLLEVYQAVGNGTTQLVSRIDMTDKKDGYFNFNGQATNLAIDDIDGDGKPEIIAPSFDQNLVGHLNIYQYNEGSKGFERILQ